jgi:hypothetical protein
VAYILIKLEIMSSRQRTVKLRDDFELWLSPEYQHDEQPEIAYAMVHNLFLQAGSAAVI